jgi:glycine/D-amino acid oxidase-like deaminating enzyme
MLLINKLSYWEKELYFKDLDFVICGAGIVGYSTALELRLKYPTAKITLLERGYLPTGASTKNAGFACFGSPSELLDDLKNNTINEVTDLVSRRYQGLQLLIERCGVDALDYQPLGSYELFTQRDTSTFIDCKDKLDLLNKIAFDATGIRDCYSDTATSAFSFQQTIGIIKNHAEGQINTGKMMEKLHQLSIEHSIHVLFGIEVLSWEDNGNSVQIQTKIGNIDTKQLIIATNGLSNRILPNEDVLPARAQVIVTSPISDLPFKGTFHYDAGYYYFRNIGNRILLGGGRNIDFQGETTDQFETTQPIIYALEKLLKEVIIPNTEYTIDYQWSGIMGVGKTKRPIIKKISPNVSIGIRMGGMGVALGSLIGKELSELYK